MTPEANRVNLWHTSFLGVMKSGESKSAVCPGQKCPIWSQIIEKSKMAANAGLKCYDAFQDVGGGHLGFFNFEASLDIFVLGIQQIQHPSIPLKSLCGIN